MQAIIDFLTEYFLELWPLARVYSWEMGVRIRNGRVLEIIQGGRLAWKLPFADEIYKEPITEQTINLPTCAITTAGRKKADDVGIIVSANVSYKVTDVRKMWLKIHDFDESLSNILTGIIAGKCAKHTWAKLKRDREEIEYQIIQDLTNELQDWGVEIVRLYLTDFVRARQYNLFGVGTGGDTFHL